MHTLRLTAFSIPVNSTSGSTVRDPKTLNAKLEKVTAPTEDENTMAGDLMDKRVYSSQAKSAFVKVTRFSVLRLTAASSAQLETSTACDKRGKVIAAPSNIANAVHLAILDVLHSDYVSNFLLGRLFCQVFCWLCVYECC